MLILPQHWCDETPILCPKVTVLQGMDTWRDCKAIIDLALQIRRWSLWGQRSALEIGKQTMG